MSADHPSGRQIRALGAALLPGCLLGAHFALLLFFLNPRLDLGVPTVLRAVVVLALALGVAVAAPLALVLGSRPGRLRRALPWCLTAALALAAAAQWIHAARFAYYLPPGINIRLLKAAIIVSLVTVPCFYTALLHSIERRRYGWRSRVALALLAVLSLLVTIERRSAFVPPAAPPSELGLRPRPSGTNLAVVAIEGATLDAILPLAEQDQLPFLATLLRQGAYGRLRTLSPPLRVAVWRSVATGAYPFRHGVVSDRTLDVPFLRPTPDVALVPWGSGFALWARPLGVRERQQPPAPRAPALWQILGGAGIWTSAVGWPADVDPGPVSDRRLPEPFWSAPDRVPAPTRAAAAAVALRSTVDSVDPAVFALLGDAVPDASKAALAEDLWREAVARDLLSRHAGDTPVAIFVGLPGLLEVSRGSFGGFAAVQFDGESRKLQLEAARRISGYYAFIDRLLGRLWSSLPEPRLLAIVSGHGVSEPRRWRRLLAAVSTERALGGRVDGKADGVFMLLGSNLRSGQRLERSALVDVAPTLLYAMGQPVPRDIDGKVATAAFGSTFLTRNPLTFVASYSALNTEVGPEPEVRPPVEPLDP